MPSLYAGLNVALRAMLAHQQAIQVIEHNVANANTPGYRRQEVVLKAGIPTYLSMFNNYGAGGEIGTGVLVDKVQRYSMDIFDARYRASVGDSKRWQLESDTLGQVESALAETGTDGLVTKLDAFWNSWQTLSVDPTNDSYRANVLEQATALAKSINERSDSLIKLKTDQNSGIVQRVAEINDLATRIADLNGEIVRVLSTNEQPNDLMDQRDLLTDRMAELTGATVSQQTNGETIVSVNGHAIVTGHTASQLTVSSTAMSTTIAWDDGQAYTPTTGEMAALINVRDVVIPGLQTGLDNLAYTLINSVNAVHNPLSPPTPPNPPYAAAGMNFFTPVASASGAAGSIQVESSMSNLDNIMGASAAYPGDGTIARQIANISQQTQAGLSGQTINNFYVNQSSSLGLRIQTAKRDASHSGTMVDALSTQRASFSGVNLDEEAANLVQSQRAYQAAARLVNIVDEMLDRVINGMGLVGR